jgi:hypothetical protein
MEERKDINGIKESWYKLQLKIQIDILNTFEKSVEPIMKNIKIANLPEGVIRTLERHCRDSYEASFPNVEIIKTFEFPKNYAYMSNFNFGKMFGKTEMILKILEKS